MEYYEKLVDKEEVISIAVEEKGRKLLVLKGWI